MGENQDKEIGKFFKGKIVLLYLNNASEVFSGGVAVYEPKIEEWCGRTFLIGVVPSNPNDWSSGLRIGVAFDQIGHFLEFSDERDFLERMSLGEKGGALHS